MTQPLDINKLAEEAVLLWNKGNRPLVQVIVCALATLAADKDAEIARHKAALKVATDALSQCGPHCEHCNNAATCREPWTEGYFLCDNHRNPERSTDAYRPIQTVATRALQRITEELEP